MYSYHFFYWEVHYVCFSPLIINTNNQLYFLLLPLPDQGRLEVALGKLAHAALLEI